MKNNNKKNLITIWTVIILLITVLTACSKENDKTEAVNADKEEFTAEEPATEEQTAEESAAEESDTEAPATVSGNQVMTPDETGLDYVTYRFK